MNDSRRQRPIHFIPGARFAEAGVQIKPRHGQNFLVDLNLLGMVVDAAELTPDDVVLEIGAAPAASARRAAARPGTATGGDQDQAEDKGRLQRERDPAQRQHAVMEPELSSE